MPTLSRSQSANTLSLPNEEGPPRATAPKEEPLSLLSPARRRSHPHHCHPHRGGATLTVVTPMKEEPPRAAVTPMKEEPPRSAASPEKEEPPCAAAVPEEEPPLPSSPPQRWSHPPPSMPMLRTTSPW
ncbi:lysine-rich arabinogalactan protein 19-like [Phragmites australis]|uniref:lysine-rich arabinogalactan protein 19-like n=1 Tax=Phragmites australis TaxID=29695 RepID=UPI002D77A703|nr:lysine-rich arabinogalactan protein 19-like [Phragmites australis]